MKFFDFKEILKKTRRFFLEPIEKAKDLDEIEERLYLSDLGSKTVKQFMGILFSLKDFQKKNLESLGDGEVRGEKTQNLYKRALKEEALSILSKAPRPRFDPSFIDKGLGVSLEKTNRKEEGSIEGEGDLKDLKKRNLIFSDEEGKNELPQVWMFVGVNGVGKTTIVGKVSYFLKKAGNEVLIVAGDTFRAAATLQLREWALRVGAHFYDSKKTKDAAALAFEACQRAKSKLKEGLKYDVILLDTAGRLTTKVNLMEELKKMKRVVQKIFPDAPQEIFVVLDAHSGQNTLFQAKEFHKALHLTGVIFNKLDGSAKGGVLLGIVNELEIPIYWLGVGERKEDLRPFRPKEFVDSLFSD